MEIDTHIAVRRRRRRIVVSAPQPRPSSSSMEAPGIDIARIRLLGPTVTSMKKSGPRSGRTA
jgi:hypothetical protein